MKLMDGSSFVLASHLPSGDAIRERKAPSAVLMLKKD